MRAAVIWVLELRYLYDIAAARQQNERNTEVRDTSVYYDIQRQSSRIENLMNIVLD